MMIKWLGGLMLVSSALAVPSVSLSAARKPSWCGAGSNGAKCYNAEFDFSNKLADKYGKAWNKAKPRLTACPWATAYRDTVFCMAYFANKGTYRFVQGSVSGSQDARDTASLTRTTSWNRKWRKCSLSGMSKQAKQGTLKSNEPCNALPIQAYYNVAVWMNGYGGYPRYSRVIAWQFAESGLFAIAGMKPVAFAHCGYSDKTITCSDSKGDSFRYHY